MPVTQLVFLKGRRVNLRPALKSDIPNLVRWINDPEIRDFVAAYLPMMERGEEEWLENLAKNRDNEIALIIETKDGQPIGIMGVHKIQWRDRFCTTGALIGECEYRNKGLGTEAKMVLLQYLFDTLNLHKVCSQVVAFNGRSYAYSRKCGYREEGRFKKHVFRRGRYWDIINLAVFREDFVRAKKRLTRRK